jgi:hypothetical protein
LPSTYEIGLANQKLRRKACKEAAADFDVASQLEIIMSKTEIPKAAIERNKA